MKKKALTVILPLCVAMAITACGGNADTTKVEETTAIEESTEDDAQAEAEVEAEAKAQEAAEAEEQARLEEASGYYEAGRKRLYGLDGTQIDMEDAYTNFTKAQELGNTDANFYLGVLADWYGYPEKDYDRARAYYEQCENNPYAQISLGVLYYNYQVIDIESVEDQQEKAEKLFQSVVDQGVADGYLGLATVATAWRLEHEPDYETALEYYQKVAEEGTEQLYVACAMKEIGNIYRFGNGVEEDNNVAIEWYTKAADLGDSNAMISIAQIYDWGDGVEEDNNAAIEWYTKAAGLGNSDAMTRLGVMYGSGEGVSQDSDTEMEWYQKAADLGNAQAMANIAVMHRYGIGVAQDANTAIEWYQKAADSGWSFGLSEIGDMYRDGEGVERDNDKALEWYMKAVSTLLDYRSFERMADILHGEDSVIKWIEESGDAENMRALGELYRSNYGYNGEQILPDYDKAIECYTKAADLGDTIAMFQLGDMYEHADWYDNVVEPDYEKAIEWYTKAADSGDADAKEHLEQLQGQ